MKPKIKLRPAVAIPPAVLSAIKSAEQRELVNILLQRYGVDRPTDLLPHQVTIFTTELQSVLSNPTPHPADAVMPPTARKPK